MQVDAQLSLKQRFRIARAKARRLLAKSGGGESAHTSWMNDCVPSLMDGGKDQPTAIAACLNMWRDAWEITHPDGAVDPGPALPEDKRLVLARAHELLAKYDDSEPRDGSGRWSGGGGDSDGPTAFVSPNVEDLKIGGAIAGLKSPRQEALRKASADVDSALGKTPIDAKNVVGAWTDGAENSLMLTMPRDWSHDQAKVAMAMKGWLGDQKSALLFTPDKAGNSFIASFPVKGKLADIHQQLLDQGLTNHTLEPISNGAMVHVYGEDQATHDTVAKALEKYDTQGTITHGRGEFIGADTKGTDREQRDAARSAYEAIIRDAQGQSAFAGRDVGKIWDDLRARWGGSLSPQQVDAKELLAARWRIVRAQAQALLKFDPSEPRDPDGKWSGGGGGESESKPSGGGKSKKPAKKEDFDKAKIKLDVVPSAQSAFIDKWNEKVGVDPAEFKSNFMGGLDGEMRLSGSGGRMSVNGEIHNAHGDELGTFTRDINLDDKSAYSAYFKLNRTATGGDIGKKMLAGNIATYKQLGIEKVEVSANIDVGGYAWAKYGYIPTQQSWNVLRTKLERKLTGGPSSSSTRPSSGNEADSWDQLSSDQQDNVRDEWMRSTRDEFIQSEEQNWRDSGQAKDDAKRELADQFINNQVATGDVPEWINEALDAAREYREDKGQSPIPYTNRQLYDAIELSYESNHGDGGDDPEIGFDDKMLQDPTGHDPAQGTLPGIEPIDPSGFLTQEMRDRIGDKMVAAFNKKAEDDAGDLDPPSYLADNAEEYQDSYWSDMSDDDLLEVAQRYNMADVEPDPDDEDEQHEMELPKTEADPLLAAVQSSNPRSIWKVADSPKGKQLLLGTGWKGVLNLKDKEQMERFNKYVGQAE